MKFLTAHQTITILLSLAWRNLWRHRRRTVITLSSISLGFGLAVICISLQDGGHNSMVRNGIKLGEGHLTVQNREYLSTPANYKFIRNGRLVGEKIDRLAIDGQVAPRVALQVLASTANNSLGAGLEGMDVELDPRVRMLKPHLIAGQWLTAGDGRELLIGSGMARRLKAKVGSKIIIMAGKKSGDFEPQLGRVRGIFSSGITAMDDFLILCDISFGRRFLMGEGGVAAQQPLTRFAVFLNEPDRLAFWKKQLQDNVAGGDVQVLDWQQMMPQLVQYIIVDDAFSYGMLLMILLLIVFGIVNTVLMSVLERTREFGLLRVLGLSRRYLLALVFCESLLLSFLAVITGWVLGGALHFYLAAHGIDFSAYMPEGTQIVGTVMDPVIRSELSWPRIVQLTVIIFAATLASGIYPAIKAARVTPVAALRT